MKPKALYLGAEYLPQEAPALKKARQHKLRLILRKGLGLTPADLKESLWPGYAESFRTEQPGAVPAPSHGQRAR